MGSNRELRENRERSQIVFFEYLAYFAVLRENLTSPVLRSFRLGDQFTEGKTQGAGDCLGRVEIGAAFPAFQQADVSLVQARHFRQRRPAQLFLFAMMLDHLRKGVGQDLLGLSHSR